MRTESRNLDWTGILSVVERQEYQRRIPVDEGDDFSVGTGTTGVTTTVMFRSRFGDRMRARARDAVSSDSDDEPKKGFLASLGTSALQRSIEAIASGRTETQMGKAKEGMVVVLDRMRQGGLGAVLEGMRRDREQYMMGSESVQG